MLGEKISEGNGKIIAQRVLPATEATGPKIEVSFQSQVKILGIDATETATYSSVLKEAGVFQGEGQGVVMTKDGDTVYWRGSGVGKPTGRGAGVAYRGCVYYDTKAARLSRLNTICAVFEYEVDENGTTRSQLWEWK